MTTRPYELLARFAPDGTIEGVTVRTITTVNGREFEDDPQPLSGATDPVFVAFTNQFSVAAIAELSACRARMVSLQTELAAAAATIKVYEASKCPA
jgi:hypothetical protein